MDSPILLVDDESTVLSQLASLLGSEGYRLITAGNGYTGLVSARKHRPGLVIVDVEMPVMDGVQFIEELSQHADTADIPVFVCSGSEEGCARAMAAGAADCMLKPLNVEVFLEKVHALYRASQP